MTDQYSASHFRNLVGGHIRLDADIHPDIMFQCFLTNNHGHFAESRIESWTESGIRFTGGPRRIVHASYVTYPWSSEEETHSKSIADIGYASRCANIVGLWGLNVHLPKEYHLSVDFERRIEETLLACEKPCKLLFEITGSSTSYVSLGKLPTLPIDRMRACQSVIERVAKRVSREDDWGFCFDTAHAFVQGQPLSTSEDISGLINGAREVRISAVHLNGSRHPFKSGRDQHSVIGSVSDFIWGTTCPPESDGKGCSGLGPLLRWIVDNDVPTVLERPGMSAPSDYEPELSRLYDIMRTSTQPTPSKERKKKS